MSVKGISQSDIVAKFDITASTVSDWCNAKKYPRVDKIQLLADYLGILKSDLTEEKSPQQILINNYIQKYESLNSLGQKKANIYIDDLLDNPRFRKETTLPNEGIYIPDNMEVAALGGIKNPQPPREEFETT